MVGRTRQADVSLATNVATNSSHAKPSPIRSMRPHLLTVEGEFHAAVRLLMLQSYQTTRLRY